MAAYDGLDDIQSQSPAVPVLTSGFIQLVEPVEYQRQLLGGDRFTFVGHGNVDLVGGKPDLQTDGTAFGAEFHRVVQKIVHDLRDVVLIGTGIGGNFRDIHFHIEVFGGDLRFKGDQHLTGTFFNVEPGLLLVGNTALILQTGNIQHTAYQPAQPFGFIGHDLHIMAAAFRGNGTVQNAVDVAADGSHGGLQFVGHIGHKFLPLILAFLQRGGHIVERQRQLVDLPGVVVLQLDPGRQISVAEGIGGFRHGLQGLTLVPGIEGHGDDGQKHHDHGNTQIDVGDPFQHQIGVLRGGEDHHNAHRLVGALVGNGDGHHIVLVAEQLVGHIGILRVTFSDDPADIGFVQLPALMDTAERRIGAEDQLAAAVTDGSVGSRNLGCHAEIHQKIPFGQGFVGVVGGGKLRDHIGIVVEPVQHGILQISGHQRPKGHSHQQKRCQQRNGYRKKRPAEGRFHWPMTSNL